MKTHVLPALMAAVIVAGAASSSGCNFYRSRALSHAACPELRAGRDALDLFFTPDPRLNGKVRTFVQAANDVSVVGYQIEMEIADACKRIGFDLGVPVAQMAPRNEQGGRASGACGAAAARIDWILRSGVSVSVSVTPPVCQLNLQASARCTASCGGPNGDAECQASCRSHAAVHSSCSPALVSVRSTGGDPRLAQTLQANLPALLHGEVALGRRLGSDVQTLVQVGSNLPAMVGRANMHALGCVAGAADTATAASMQIGVSVRASAGITGRVGATGG